MSTPRARRLGRDCQRGLRTDSDPRRLAFELEGALLSANWYFLLYGDATYMQRARRAVRARLTSEATPAGLRKMPSDP